MVCYLGYASDSFDLVRQVQICKVCYIRNFDAPWAPCPNVCGLLCKALNMFIWIFKESFCYVQDSLNMLIFRFDPL